jgi:hypothetical protein
MNLQKIQDSWKSFAAKLNAQGIPIPLIRDPQTSKGSVPLTLVILSTCILVVGIVGKWAGHLGGVDMANAMQFFYTACSLYFGHSWVHKETSDASGHTQTLDLKTGDPDKDQ